MNATTKTVYSVIVSSFFHAAVEAAELDPSSYAASDQVSLGMISAQVLPEKYLKIESPVNGLLYVRERAGFHEKGTIWSEVEPDLLALEKEALDIQLALFEAKEKPQALLEIADARVALENRRDELKRNAGMLEDIIAEPELAELYLGKKEGEGGNSREAVAEMRARIAKQLAAIESALEYVGTGEQEKLEIRFAELELDRKKLDFSRREREARFKMPFSGELKYMTEIPADLSTPIELQPGQSIAELSRFGRLECQVIISSSAVRQMPPVSLRLLFPRNGNAGQFEATFVRKESREVYGKPETVYIFNFSEKDAEVARILIGGRVQAELVCKLSTKARLIPKMDVVRKFPEGIRHRGWKAGLENGVPGWRVLVIGQSYIAVSEIKQSDE